jgi:hypothetical protein
MASIVHMTQGICMFFAHEPIIVTSVSMLYLFPWKLPGLILFAAGLLALYGIAFPMKSDKLLPFHVLAVVPQQIFMLTAAWAGLDAMHAGHFADGVVKSTSFITVDQCIYPAFALCHFASVINHFISDPL